MNLKQLLIFPALLLGLGIGRWSAGEPTTSPQGPTATTLSRARELGSIERSFREGVPSLSRGSQSKDEESSSSDADIVSDEFVRVPVSLLSLDRISMPALTMDDDFFEPDDELLQVLELSDQEKQSLQMNWRKACERIREAEVAGAEFVDREDGSLLIRVDSAAEEREQERIALEAAAIESLGVDRGKAMIALKGGKKLLAARSEGVVEYSVQVESNGSGGWHFKMEENGDNRRIWITEQIPQQLKHLAKAGGILPLDNGNNEEEE